MKWRVYNNHPDGLTHKENFRGDEIIIKAGDFILMDYEDAVQFKGQYFPMTRTADGAQDPKSFKVIKLSPDEQVEAQPVKQVFVCQIDGKQFDTMLALDAHMKKNYADVETFKDDLLEEEIKKEAQAKSVKRKPKAEKDATL